MAGRNIIKGLTVEIGGDTTNLGKALESVNKRSDELTSELKEIDRLLKFDPENTELLAQRQKVLAGTIENTSDRLRTLREAERQVQAQFERGEVSEAQVRALQREIIATEGKLKHYQTAAADAAKSTDKLGDEAEETGGAFEGMGSKLGHAAKVGIGAVVAGATAAVGALTGSAESTREYRAEMGKLETAYETVGHRTEIAEEAYKRLYGVIGETDQTVEASQQIALLAESEEDVIKWADLGAGVVARFGDALQPEAFFEAANETIKLGEATGAYTQMLEQSGYDVDKFNAGLAACTTESEKQAYMLKVSDEILAGAADTYRETNAEVINANDANAAWMATMAEVGTAVEPVLTDVKLLGASLLGELVPGITGVTSAFGGLINGEEGSAEALGGALSTLLTQILTMAVEMLPSLVTAAMSLITSFAVTLIEMLPQLVETGILLIMSVLDGLVTAIPLIIQALVEMIPQLVSALVSGIPQIIDGAVQLLLAIVDAIPLLLPVLAEAIPEIVIAIINGLLGALPDLIEGAIGLLMGIYEAIPVIIQKILPRVPDIVDALIDGLLNCIPTLIDAAIDLLFAIFEAFPEFYAALFESAPSIVTSLIDGLLKCIPSLLLAGAQLIEGLVEGMVNFDYMGALSKLGNGIVKGFKKIFDINSPSRVMAEIGELLDAGLAVGITEGARLPVNALDKLSQDMVESTDSLNGVTLERKVAHSFSANPAASAADGISGKLDKIYQAILSGQVIMLDGKTLVGSTATRYDTELGQRRVLAERGAL